MPPIDGASRTDRKPDTIDKIIAWVGSIASLVLHTLMFVVFFLLSFLAVVSWNLMLLVLTTVVSLEAIYLAIFIQMTVNRHTVSLREVEHNIDEIEEDIDEIQEDFEEMSEEDKRELIRDQRYQKALDALTADVRRALEHLEQLKKRS